MLMWTEKSVSMVKKGWSYVNEEGTLIYLNTKETWKVVERLRLYRFIFWGVQLSTHTLK